MTFAEARSAKSELDQLESVPLGRMYQASFQALMRLQLYFTGRTHELMLEFRDKATGAMLRAVGPSPVPSPNDRNERGNLGRGALDGSSGFALQAELLRMWGDTWSAWTAEFQQVRREAGWIAFGVQAVFHERLVREAASTTLAEARSAQREITESITDGVYDPQLRILLNVAEQYLYGDSLNLSGRIWRIDRETRDGINAVLLNGIQRGASAWDLAKELEQFLGAGQDCPRWTSTRLYGKTKQQIAGGDLGGLLSDSDCDGRGVAYNALRLARTEIQKIHSLATDRMMAQQPWVREEQVHLSAAHPEEDICDETVSGGRDGQGIYSVGEIELPLHPNCLCYKTAVLMPEKEFTGKLRGWMTKSESWPEMDQYAADLGVDLSTSLLPAATRLAVWLFGDQLEKWLQ